MKTIDLEQNTEDWLKFRRTKIGASDASIILGENPWTTPLQLWRRKKGYDPEQGENDAIKRGKELEPIAREYLEKEWGHNFCPIVGQSEKYDWQIASFDAWSPDLNHYVEIKCPGEKTHQIAKEGKVPTYYLPQLLHQMLVAEVDKITYLSFDGKEGVFIDVNLSMFSDTYIHYLILKEIEFSNFLKSREEPPATDKDFIIREDAEWKSCVTAYIAKKREREKLELEEKEYREKLIQLASGSNSMGAGLKLRKVVSKGHIDLNSIPQIKDIDLDKYRKPSTESWRIFF